MNEIDHTKWSISSTDGHLEWRGGNQRCDLPHGVQTCYKMFQGCVLDDGFYFGDFDTSAVVDMQSMFHTCKLPQGFSLGKDFNTSKVINMSKMFYDCKLPEGFTLGDKFDTSNVLSMMSMFENCQFPKGFTLGDKFKTSKVRSMFRMFSSCEINEDFSLGKHFSIPGDYEYLDLSYKYYEEVVGQHA